MNPVYTGETGIRLFSPALWWDLPLLNNMAAMAKHRFIFDDFHLQSGFDGSAEINGLTTVEDTGVTFTRPVDSHIGELDIAGADADNDEGYLSYVAPLFKFETEKKLWFEARIKKASIDANDGMIFIGLAWDAGGGSAVPAGFLEDNDGDLIGTSTGSAGMSAIGFNVPAADSDSPDFVYGAEGKQPSTDFATVPSNTTDVATMVADTYIKLGFKYDPNYSEAGRFAIYVDGVEAANKVVTKANIDASTFPEDELLTPTFCFKIGSTADKGASIDWWACAQEE